LNTNSNIMPPVRIGHKVSREARMEIFLQRS